MNETESEARRLLTAGTSDMPEGIDLLDGFTRTRSRTRRRRGRAVLSAAAAVTAAGATVGTVTAIALTASPAPTALAAITSALNRTLTGQSYSVSSTYGVYYLTGGKIQHSAITPEIYSCTGEQNPARGLAKFSCPDAGDPATLEVGGYTYIYQARLSAPYHYKRWVRSTLAPVMQFQPSLGPSLVNPWNDTPQIMSVLKKGAKVTVAGPVSGPGWTGTRYTFTWKGKPLQVGDMTLPPQTESGTVEVDQQGQTRVLDYDDWSTAGDGTVVESTADETFSDFGERVTVTPPPTSQTYIDSWRWPTLVHGKA
jgi:hypothetical protein